MALVRITSMVMRLCALVVLVLGILLWTSNYDNLKPIHMLVGILIVLSLWLLAFLQFRGGGSASLTVAAFVLGLVVAALGITQESILPGSTHWVVQVVHLLLGLSAVGFGEVLAGRYQRAKARARVA